jgi:pyruvate formate lyase activating enzyme
MLISGLQKLTLMDYPDKVSAVLFTPGCNFRCGFCHNSEFVLPEKLKKIKKDFLKFEEVLEFLKKRKDFLDGVVFCGGEPTIHSDLADCIKKVKDLGFLIKLDTNGTNPQVLKNLLQEKLLDYIAMDLKFDEFNQDIYGINFDFNKLLQSIEIIENAKIDYEFRTTLIKEYHSKEKLFSMSKMIKKESLWAWQKFDNKNTLSKKFNDKSSYTEKEILNLKEEFLNLGFKIITRF